MKKDLIIKDNDKEISCDILFKFESKETNKHYIVYEESDINDCDTKYIHAFIYDPTGVNNTLIPITDDKEWQVIEDTISAYQNNELDNY